MKNTCKNCKYWEAHTCDTIYGICRRYPPCMKSTWSEDCFPRIANDEWCGEHKKKPTQKPENTEKKDG